MGRSCEGPPAKHIVSVRVTAEEMTDLQQLAEGLGVNISTLLRQSLNLITEEAMAGKRFTERKDLQGRPFRIVPAK